MKQEHSPARRAAGLLIAAAALPLTPAFAQDTTQTTQPPPAAQPSAPPPAQAAPVDVTPPPAPTVTQTPAPAPVPTVNLPPPPTSAPAGPARSTAPARATVRPPVRAPASFATAARPARAAPTAAATAPAPAAAPVATSAPAPAAVAPAPAPAAVTPAPEPAPAPIPPATTRADAPRGGALLPWIVIGLLVLGLIGFAATRRRRRSDVVYEDTREEPAVAPVAAPADDWGRPWLDLALEPVRAGVEGDEAKVEFALKVDNHGVAPARDVRVSAFMLQAGASEAERNLIAPKQMPPVTIAPGETKQVETAVALPRDQVQGDAVLPVVVADARYTLPDGSEGRTSASFAVGVPDGEELAHFAVDNPSGLHDDVVARPLGEMEKA